MISKITENSTAPAVEAIGDGDVRAWYYQTNDARHRWNVWYRTSANGGKTWSRPELLSDADSGAGYKHPEYMSVVFKRLTGQTPGSYRRQAYSAVSPPLPW